MYEKPMTPNQKENGNKLYRYLYYKGTATKEQMLEFLGWDKSKDRQLRDLISFIAKKVPIIATSDKKGYSIAKDEKDLDDVIHQWKEHDKRQQELETRKKPLIEFYEKYRRK